MTKDHPGYLLIERAALNLRTELLTPQEATDFLRFIEAEVDADRAEQVIIWLEECLKCSGYALKQQVKELLLQKVREYDAWIAEEQAIERARKMYGGQTQ